MNPFQLSGLSSSKFLKYGRTSTSYQITKLVEDIRLYLATEKGTLFGRPDYGTEIYKYLFEPTIESTGEAIRQEVVSALKRSYPELALDRVDIKFIPNGINVNIYYSVNQNGLSQLLDFDILRERESYDAIHK
jgi:phage baseplate assembly protein W